MAPPIPPSLYGQVIEWVTQQQQLALAGQPVTMTAAQRKTLLELHQLVKPAEVEPDLGAAAEWIGLLNQYRQAHPSTMGIEYTDKPVGEPPLPIRWIVTCRIAECPEAFPGPAGGLDPATGMPPSFARKQSAKHYAAKCAYEWLLENQHMRTGPHNQQTGGKHIQQPPAPNGGAPVNPAGATRAPGAGEGQVRNQATALCVELNLPPPQYHISEVGHAYDGFATFEGIAQHKFPPGGLGHVKQALTKNVAREMIAEEVVKELLKMKQERNRQSAAILEPVQ